MPRAAFLIASGVLALYAVGILSIGLTRDWRLIHEDNGAMHTTFALSHLELGLERTRAHDLFFNPTSGEGVVYGHHPPATALILAGAFALTGSDAPWVALMVVILFHLGSLFLLVTLLSRLFSTGTALLGGFLMATLPMSAYFGRMVNYEPLCLFAVLLVVSGYAAFKDNGGAGGLARLCLGILFGGLIDWAAFFFAAAIATAEATDALRHRSRSFVPFLFVIVSAVGVFLFDLWHLWYAGRGSLTPLGQTLSAGWPVWQQQFLLKFFSSQIDNFRRYYTHVGLLSSLLASFCLVAPRTVLSRSLFNVPDARRVKRLLVVTGAGALGYILAAPSWAQGHAYWQFYGLPFVVLCMVLVLRLLWQKVGESRHMIFRTLLVMFVLEVGLTSAYMLHLRHTRIGDYAVRQTANLRATYLSPMSFKAMQSDTTRTH